jgi:predicted SnoaL-like aldol condensation-catalyzing enzyme
MLNKEKSRKAGKSIIPGIAMLICFSATGQTSNQQETMKTKTTMTNVAITQAVNKAVQAGDVEAIASLVPENYIQHTPVVPDGRKGLELLVTKIRNKEMPGPQIKNVRTFTDGDYVILHHDVQWPNRKAMFEIFRMEGGLAAEHWSGIQDHPEKTANGHTMVDGATEVTDKANTAKNKELAKSFVETVLIKGEFDKILNYYHPDIIQHNPFIDNTVPGLVNGIGELQKQGITLQIQKIWNVFGEGNFVLVCSTGLFTGKPTAFFDLFRTEKGKIVEHWDVIQEIPAAEKQAHRNGFF